MPFWNAPLSIRIQQYTSCNVMLFQSPSRHRFGPRSANNLHVTECSFEHFGKGKKKTTVTYLSVNNYFPGI